MSPQAKYNREVRQCPIVRKIEAEKQKERRNKEQVREHIRAYDRAYWHLKRAKN